LHWALRRSLREECAHGWAILYRGTIVSAGNLRDVATLEGAVPVWLLEYLLLGRASRVAVVKVQFALLHREEQLPGLVNLGYVTGAKPFCEPLPAGS
jgi:WD repeat-containing protein 48